MMVQSSRKNTLINKEEIVNYQFQILQQCTPLAKPTISHTNKYSLWDLDAKVREAVGDHAFSVRWIGNSETAYLETYAYIMLIAASHSEANIIQFKQIIYKIGRQCLNLHQQKLLVQFLCLIQYSRDRYAFLNKYPQIQALLIKILHYVEEDFAPTQDSVQEIKKKAKVRRKTSAKRLSKQMQKKQSNGATYRSKNSDSLQTQYQKELQQIYSGFNKHFQFISILGSNEYSCSLKLFETKKIYVIIEKDCYFMVEIAQKSQKTFLQFTLGNKYLNQSLKEEIQDQIRTEIKTNLDEKVNFNRQELEAIMEYQNQVQQSKVIPIERASQIRSPMNDRFGGNDPRKMEQTHFAAQYKHSRVGIVGDKSQVEIDKTFIDQLIANPAINNEKEATKIFVAMNESKLPPHIQSKKYHIMQKMKQFKKMKEAIQQVRVRIEGKLKKIDEVDNYKSEIASKNLQNKESQNAETQKSLLQRKEEQFQHFLSQPNINFTVDSVHNRKESFNVPKSLPSFPDSKNLEELFIHHRSEHKIPQALTSAKGKNLSQKAYSRPQSKVRSPQESLQKSAKLNAKAAECNNKDSFQTLSPSNVHVNVNVSINESLLNPRYTAPNSTFLKQQLQKYATNKPNNCTSLQSLTPNYKWCQNQSANFYFPAAKQEIISHLNAPWANSKQNNALNRNCS